MRATSLRLLSLLLVFGALSGCDTGGADAPDAASLVGTYGLVRYGGSALPSGGITAGELRLRIEETIPVYHVEWVRNGTRFEGDGLYTVAGNTISFFGSLNGGTFDHSGVVSGRQITLSVNDGTFTTFTFERR